MTPNRLARAKDAVSNLPDRVKIAGFDFVIERWPSLAATSAHRYGECATVEQTIRIREDFASPQKVVDTFLHECLHAIFWAYDVQEKDDEEHECHIISTALTALHRDNPWLAIWIADYARAC